MTTSRPRLSRGRAPISLLLQRGVHQEVVLGEYGLPVVHAFRVGGVAPAGKSKGRGATGHGNRYLGQALGEAAVAAARTHTFLGERYRRLARRRGGPRATVAVGRSILVIIWHLLSQPETPYHDLGPDYTRRRIDPNHRTRNHVRQLEALGYTVTLTPVA